MTPEEMQAALELKFTQVQTDLAEAQKNNASKDDILAWGPTCHVTKLKL